MDISPEIFKNPLPISNSSFESSSPSTESTYNGVLPKIYEVGSQTYSAFLLETLPGWLHHVSLVEFYNLLHKPNPGYRFRGIFSNESSSRFSKREAFGLCSFILETFTMSCKGTRYISQGSRKKKTDLFCEIWRVS